MAQIRSFDYGSNYSWDKHASIMKSTNALGVYNGFPITVVDNNSIRVGPGAAVFDPGVCVEETSSVDTQVVSPEEATVYTVVYEYAFERIIGGAHVAAVHIVEGEYTSYEYSIVLGWIDHPGGGVAFKQEYVVENFKFRISKFDYITFYTKFVGFI